MKPPLRLFALALVVGAAAFPGAAQDLRYSWRPVADCLSAAGTEAERRDCIGRAAQSCIEATPDGSTTYGSEYCWDREREDWGRALNVTYQRLMRAHRADDAEMAELGSAAPPVAAALQRMQAAWVAFRDASCGYELAQWGGGSGGGPAYAYCQARMTAEQLFYLQGFAGMR